MSIFYSMIDFAELAVDLVREHSEWSQATFGSDAVRGPRGPLKHLAREAVEAVEAVESGDPSKVREELADCLLLILDASRRAGITPMELFRAGYEKLQVNKSRQWPAASPDEPVEHIQ